MDENKSLLDDVKSNYTSASVLTSNNESDVSEWVDIYNSEKYGNEQKQKSQYVSSMVKEMVNWQVPSLVEPFTSSEGIVTCEPVTHDDVETARQAEMLLNYQFSRDFPRFQFMSDLAIRIMVEGTVFIKTYWEFEEREVTEIITKEVPMPMDPMMEATMMEEMQMAMAEAEQMGQDPMAVQDEFIANIPMQTIEEEVTTMKKIRNRPRAMITELKDTRIDPTCRGNLEEAKFIIHDFETDISTLRKDGRYKDLDKLEEEISNAADTSYNEKAEGFTFSDKARKKFIVHEYWGEYDINDDGLTEPIVVCWVGDTIIRQDENPLEEGKLPFVRAVYSRTPGSIYGEPLAELIGDKQRIDSVLHRGIFDDMKRANNGQRGTKKGFTDNKNNKRFADGLDFEYNTTMGEVWEGKYTAISNSVFDVVGLNRQRADAMGGIKSFDQGTGGNSLGSTAAAVNATTTSSAKREMQIIRGIAEDALIPMLEIWLAYDALFLDEEEVIRITSQEFVTIKRDDLDGNIDIKMSVETQEAKAMKADRLAFLLQTTAQGMGFEERNIIVGDMMDINDMPELGEKIRNMQPPEPSQEEQHIQKLQIELLEAQVQNERAKARENEIDYELKSAKTQNELAKARLTESGADMSDLDYLRKDEGEDHRQAMEMKDKDRANNKAGNVAKYETERMKAQNKAKEQKKL